MENVIGAGWRSAAGIVTGFGGFVLNFVKSVADYRDKRRAAAAHWRFDVSVDTGGESDTEAYRNAQVTWWSDPTLPIEIKGVAVKPGEDFELIPVKWEPNRYDPPAGLRSNTDHLGEEKPRGAQKLSEADFHKRTFKHDGADFVEVWFFVIVPTRPFYVGSNETSLDVDVSYEDCFGKRQQHRIPLNSGKLLWADRGPTDDTPSGQP